MGMREEPTSFSDWEMPRDVVTHEATQASTDAAQDLNRALVPAGAVVPTHSFFRHGAMELDGLLSVRSKFTEAAHNARV